MSAKSTVPRPALTRRQFAALGAAGAASLALPALSVDVKPEKARVVIAVSGKASLYYLPLTIAEQLGYFRAEGLDVEISDVAGGARAVQALAGGAADIISGPYEQTIQQQAKAQGQALQAFVLLGRAPQIAMGVSTRTLPQYRGVADLRGRKVGVTAPDSPTHMMAHLLLSRGGLKPAEVNFVGVGNAAGALASMRAGQIDAISNVDPVMTLLEQRGEVKIIGDTRTLKGTLEVFGGPMPAGCLLAPVEFIARHPATAQALANAVVHALKWLQTAGPSDIIKTVPESHMFGDRALYLNAFNKVREALSLDGLMSDDGARTALKALASMDAAIRPEKIELARTYTNQFSRRAKDRFKA
ncbi:MAG: ABC transporter substrate-binding protein [Burkholderiaceae bacterium]